MHKCNHHRKCVENANNVSNSVSTNSVVVVHDELVYLLLLFYKVSFVPRPLGKEGPGDEATTKSDCKHIS